MRISGKCKGRVFVGQRPIDVPQDWIIYNAPRPLVGDKMWQGDCFSGVFYAAVDPRTERFLSFDATNNSLDARALVYARAEEAISLTKEAIRRRHKERVLNILTNRELLDLFYDMVDEGEIELDPYNP